MKKGMSKVLSVLLIAVLVFTSGTAVFADTEQGQMVEEKTTVEKAAPAQELKAAGALEAALEKGAQTKASGGFKLYTMTPTLKVDSIQGTAITYGAGDTLTGYQKGYAQAVKLPARGTIIMGAQIALPTSGTGYATFGLYKDRALTQRVEATGYVSIGDAAKTTIIQVPKAGTYYLGVQSFIGSSSSTQNYAIAAAVIYANGGDRTLTSGKTISVGQKASQTNYFKIKAKNTGYIRVRTSESLAKVTLCSSKKKALSGETYARYAPTYGVKKNSTYYIKVKSSYNSEGGFNLKATNVKVTEKSGKTKSRAVTLAKKKTKKGTIQAGSSQADWYKFRLTGKKAVKITMKGGTNDKLNITVYKGGRKIGTRTFYYSNKSLTLNSLGKWTFGTYYIKVSRADKKSSGYYSLSWK